jgi:hypothetical protein
MGDSHPDGLDELSQSVLDPASAAALAGDPDAAPPVVKSTDMPDVMQQHALQATIKARIQAKEEGETAIHNESWRVTGRLF